MIQKGWFEDDSRKQQTALATIRFENELNVIVALSKIAANPKRASELKSGLTEYMRGRRFRVFMMRTQFDLKKDCTDSLAGLSKRYHAEEESYAEGIHDSHSGSCE